MKKIFIYSGALLLVLNSLFGLILSAYEPFNWGLNDGVILVNLALFNYLSVSGIKDGFKFFMTLFFIVSGSAEFLLGLFMKSYFTDNLLLILLCLILIIQVGVLAVIRSVSNYA
tara:strand:+ start:224 stop:565 length:342 start_codon:yes stop_codon:yes gene_type:complete